MKLATLFGSFLLIVISTPAKPGKANPVFQHGLWACSTPLDAAGLQSDLNNASQEMQLTYSIADQISDHETNNSGHACKRINSDELKPNDVEGIAFNGETFHVTDGKNNGWVGAKSYFEYMQFHVVKAN